MKQIGLLKAIRMTYKANKLSIEERKYLQQQRLQKLVQYAKANSPYFAQKYAELDESFTLQDLPVTNKVELMSCFNEWVDRTRTSRLKKSNALWTTKITSAEKWTINT